MGSPDADPETRILMLEIKKMLPEKKPSHKISGKVPLSTARKLWKKNNISGCKGARLLNSYICQSLARFALGGWKCPGLSSSLLLMLEKQPVAQGKVSKAK